MLVIDAVNVNDALDTGIAAILEHGEPLESRAGATLEIPMPVTTVYRKPWERVLISKARDANPFFHLMESLWILAGRNDVNFLTEFNSRMVDYSDDGSTFNAPYGYRLRNGVNSQWDQLESVIQILKEDPLSRQAVCQIWDDVDLHKKTYDKACNMQIVFRIRNGHLCMTVYNRSNDMVWGAYGANVVQFSMIQEYVAAHLGLPLGTYSQVSNSFHVYTEGAGGKVWNRLVNNYTYDSDPYDNVHEQMFMTNQDMPAFEHDLKQFFEVYDDSGLGELNLINYWESAYFRHLVMPMLRAYMAHRNGDTEGAIDDAGSIGSDDWAIACQDWLGNRLAAKLEKENANS